MSSIKSNGLPIKNAIETTEQNVLYVPACKSIIDFWDGKCYAWRIKRAYRNAVAA